MPPLREYRCSRCKHVSEELVYGTPAAFWDCHRCGSFAYLIPSIPGGHTIEGFKNGQPIERSGNAKDKQR